MNRFVTSALFILGGMLPTAAAQAGDKYQSTVVETASNPSDFHLTKHGKISFKPSTKPGDGGIVTQLNLKGIDCPPPGPGNDGGTTGKCGVAGSPVVNHVLSVGVNFAGADLDEVAGVKYRIEKGAVAFQATGKNKIGGATFGALVSLIFNQPLGIGVLKLRTPGSDPSDCDTVPLASGNGCTDGDLYAVAGIVAGSDPGVSCTSDAQCGVTATCESGICTPEPCTVDADCDEGGGTGSGQCGSNGSCCDPSIDPTCAGQV
jgi:hypothetical protein